MLHAQCYIMCPGLEEVQFIHSDFLFQATAEANNLAALANSKDSYTKRMERVSVKMNLNHRNRIYVNKIWVWGGRGGGVNESEDWLSLLPVLSET